MWTLMGNKMNAVNNFGLCIITYLNVVDGNVALYKMTNYSSSSGNYTSSLTVDGLTSGPCSVSNSWGYQWIYVDLIWSYNIQKISVWAMNISKSIVVATDLGNFKNLKTIESLPNVCTLESKTSNGLNSINNYSCSVGLSSIGRYIVIAQPSSSVGQLQICEVQVEGCWSEALPERENVLLLKQAQTYTGGSGVQDPSRSVDGNRDTYQGRGYCTETKEIGHAQNWIKVDMIEEYQIDYMALTIRDSPIGVARAQKFLSGFSTSNFTALVRGEYPFCGWYIGQIVRGSRLTTKCNANLPAYRYFIAQQDSNAAGGYFGACELEAYPAYDVNAKIWKRQTTNVKLNNMTFSTMPASGRKSPWNCIKYCNKLGPYECDSINYNIDLDVCELNKHKNGYLESDLVPSLGWSFWPVVYAGIVNL